MEEEEVQKEAEAEDSTETAARSLIVQRLFDAACRGYTKVLDKVGGDHRVKSALNEKDGEYNDYTPLMYACERGNSDFVEELLRKGGVDVKSRSKHRMTALHIACCQGHLNVVQKLLTYLGLTSAKDTKKLLSAKTKEQWTALMFAVKKNHLEIVKFLLALYKEGIFQPNKEGQTVLHVASREGHLSCLKELKNANEFGAKINAVDKNGWNMLHHACACKKPQEEISAVIEWIVESVAPNVGQLLNGRSEKGYTPLMIACNYSNVGAVKKLVELKDPSCDPTITGNEGISALHLVAIHDADEIARMLVDNKCPLDLKESKGNTALHLAHQRGSEKVEAYLKQVGGDNLAQMTNNDGEMADQVEVRQIIPSEIRKRGPEAIEVYQTALREGRGKVPRCKLLVLGKERVGKTNLLLLLRGKEFVPESNSTEGIETDMVSADAVELPLESEGNKNSPWGDRDKLQSQFPDVASSLVRQEIGGEEPAKKKIKRDPALTENAMLAEVDTAISQLPVSEPSVDDLFRQLFPSRAKRAKKALKQKHRRKPHQQPARKDAQSDGKQTAANQGGARPKTPAKSPQQQQGSASNPKSPPRQPRPHTRQVSRKIDRTLKEQKQKKKSVPPLVLVTYDFAGQPLYRPMHHCFITYRAVYTIVFNLRELLGEEREKHYQEIAYWLNTIHAHSPSDSAPPPVILVGTHRGTSSEDLEKIGKKEETENLMLSEEDSKTINEELYRRFYEEDKSDRWVCHLKFMDEKRQLCAYIENSQDEKSGLWESSGAKELQARVQENIEKMPFSKEKHPVRWLRFEDRLVEMRMRIEKEGTKSILTDLEELRSEAELCGIVDNEEFKLCLKFFHDLGTLVYPDELPALFLSEKDKKNLKSVVLLKPQWLADIMKDVVKLEAGDKTPVDAKDKRRFLVEGRASKALLKEMWSKYFAEESIEESFKKLCLFLQAFCLLFPANAVTSKEEDEDTFLVPCKLVKKKSSLPDQVQRIEGMVTFFFDFKGYLPVEVFHQLVCGMLMKQKELPHRSEHKFHYNWCVLNEIHSANWWMELDQEQCLIKIRVKPSATNDPITNPGRLYLLYLHTRAMMDICEKSGLQGIVYVGGPRCTLCRETVPHVTNKSKEFNEGATCPVCMERVTENFPFEKENPIPDTPPSPPPSEAQPMSLPVSIPLSTVIASARELLEETVKEVPCPGATSTITAPDPADQSQQIDTSIENIQKLEPSKEINPPLSSSAASVEEAVEESDVPLSNNNDKDHEVLTDVAEEVVSKEVSWRKFASKGLHLTQEEIRKASENGGDDEDKCLAVLEKWVERGDATRGKLNAAMNKFNQLKNSPVNQKT